MKAENIYKEDIVIKEGVNYTYSEDTKVDLWGKKGYILDIEYPNDCKTTVKTVKDIIDNGMLTGAHNRAIIYNENLYDYINEVFISSQNLIVHNIDDSIKIEYNVKSFMIYFDNGSTPPYVKSQSIIIFYLFISFYAFEMLIDIAAPVLNKSLNIRHILNLNNIVNVAIICSYKMLYYDKMFLLPNGVQSVDQLLQKDFQVDGSKFMDLSDNQLNFFSSINFVGLILITLFFKVLIQMNFIKFWSELVNIFRLSSESIFFAFLMICNMAVANAFLLMFIFGMYEEQCNTLLKAFNYYLYLIFYSKSSIIAQ